MPIELTAEQSQAVAAEGERLVLIDPQTKQAYRLVTESEHRTFHLMLLHHSDDVRYEFPELILRARAAMRRDLPALLASWWTRGKWVCYTAAGRVAISRNYQALIGEVARRGIPEGDYIIERITPGAVSEAEEWSGNRPG